MSGEPKVSPSFACFAEQAAEHHKAWMEAVFKLDAVGKLDAKTKALAYLAVLAALRMESGVPFHAKHAKLSGASREEVVSSVLLGLPAAGNAVVQSLPAALEAYDED